MRTISIIAQKGGVGKTTLTTNLSAALPGATAIIDIDPQGSAFDWTKLRKSNAYSGRPDAIRAEAGEIAKWKAAAERNGTEWLLIDTVGTSNSVMIEVARASDMILIPTFVNSFDIVAVKNTVHLLKGFGIPKFVVLNRIETVFGFQKRESRAERTIHGFGGTLAEVRLGSFKDFPEAAAVGLAAHELTPNGKAAKQVLALAEFAAAKMAA